MPSATCAWTSRSPCLQLPRNSLATIPFLYWLGTLTALPSSLCGLRNKSPSITPGAPWPPNPPASGSGGEVTGWLGTIQVHPAVSNPFGINAASLAESEEELKSLLMKVKEESEKIGLTVNIQKTKIMASGSITKWQIDKKQWKQWQIIFWGGSKITSDGDCSHEIKRLTPWKESYDQPRQHIKNQGHYFANKGLSSQRYSFSSSHVCMWELDYKESWALKNWCFWTVVLEETVESPLDCKKIQPVPPKGDQSWVFIWSTNTLATWREELTH